MMQGRPTSNVSFCVDGERKALRILNMTTDGRSVNPTGYVMGVLTSCTRGKEVIYENTFNPGPIAPVGSPHLVSKEKVDFYFEQVSPEGKQDEPVFVENTGMEQVSVERAPVAYVIPNVPVVPGYNFGVVGFHRHCKLRVPEC